jgi:hypothetical protein
VKPVLHIAAAVRPGARGATSAAILRWEGAESSRIIARRWGEEDLTAAAYRAIVLGLLEARRLRAHAVVVSVEDAGVVAQLDGRAPPPPALGLYLQVRALLNAFRSARVRHGARPAEGGASDAASLDRRRACTDLPLWAAAS